MLRTNAQSTGAAASTAAIATLKDNETSAGSAYRV